MLCTGAGVRNPKPGKQFARPLATPSAPCSNQPGVANVEIRELRLDDSDQIRALWEEAFGPQSSDVREALALKLTRDPDLALGAFEGDRLLATIIGGWDGWRAWIYRAAVAKDARRRGIASALTEELERRLIAKGAQRALLMYWGRSDDPRAFWPALGYRPFPLVGVMGRRLDEPRRPLAPQPLPPEIAKHQGRTGISSHWDEVLANDLHSPGSVDAVLSEGQVRLNDHTREFLYSHYTPTFAEYLPGSRPFLEKIVAPLCADSSPQTALNLARWVSQIEHNFPTPERPTARGFYPTPDSFLWGGTEEEVIKKGSDWCTELARVYCVLAQVAGIPARIVFCYDLARQLHGHCANEVFLAEGWRFIDPQGDCHFEHPSGEWASAWEVMHKSGLTRCGEGWRAEWYLHPKTDLAMTIVNYFVMDHHKYDYRWDPINDYYRKILAPQWGQSAENL